METLIEQINRWATQLEIDSYAKGCEVGRKAGYEIGVQAKRKRCASLCQAILDETPILRAEVCATAKAIKTHIEDAPN